MEHSMGPTGRIKIRGFSQFTALAVLCVVCGALLTLDNVGVLDGVWRFWPIFPLFLGVGSVFFFRSGGKKDIIAFGLGIFLIQISLLFFILNYSSWSLMATLWPVFIGIFGATLVFISYYSQRLKWLLVSGLFFVFLCLTFFMVFTIDEKLWPISLILFGIWVLLLPVKKGGEIK